MASVCFQSKMIGNNDKASLGQSVGGRRKSSHVAVAKQQVPRAKLRSKSQDVMCSEAGDEPVNRETGRTSRQQVSGKPPPFAPNRRSHHQSPTPHRRGSTHLPAKYIPIYRREILRKLSKSLEGLKTRRNVETRSEQSEGNTGSENNFVKGVAVEDKLNNVHDGHTLSSSPTISTRQRNSQTNTAVTERGSKSACIECVAGSTSVACHSHSQLPINDGCCGAARSKQTARSLVWTSQCSLHGNNTPDSQHDKDGADKRLSPGNEDAGYEDTRVTTRPLSVDKYSHRSQDSPATDQTAKQTQHCTCKLDIPRDITEDNNPAQCGDSSNPGPPDSGDHVKSSRRGQMRVFSRMSQEAQWAISETWREMIQEGESSQDVNDNDKNLTQLSDICDQKSDGSCSGVHNSSTEQVSSSCRGSSSCSTAVQDYKKNVNDNDNNMNSNNTRLNGSMQYAGLRRQTRSSPAATDTYGRRRSHPVDSSLRSDWSEANNHSKINKNRTRVRGSRGQARLTIEETPTKLPDINGNSAPSRAPAGLGEYTLTQDVAQPSQKTLAMAHRSVIPSGSKLSREQSFQITPMGYDSRYRDTVAQRDLNGTDETPEEVKAKAIEKCNEWFDKYW